MITVKKDWWKNFFNEIYLITDARSVCDARLTSLEVDLLEKVLNLNKNDRILDLCGGQGRHSIELARRGYRDLTVIDYSDYLINLGKKAAQKTKLKIKFYRRDARSTGLDGNDYSVIVVMANSFGYFPQEKENLRILKESYRLLKAKGRLFIVLTDPVYVKNNLKPTSWHRTGNIFVLRQRQTIKDIVKAREIVISKKEGLLRDACYCERLYNKGNIYSMLKSVGLKNIRVENNPSLHQKKQDYGFLSSVMIVTATK